MHRQSVEDELVEASRIQTITICILSLVLVISPLIIFLVRNATQTIQVDNYRTRFQFFRNSKYLDPFIVYTQTFASGLVSKTTELKRERKRCDRLLCQMLPKAVVRQLKERKQVLQILFFFYLRPCYRYMMAGPLTISLGHLQYVRRLCQG